MEHIQVSTGKPYQVKIGEGLLSTAGAELKQLSAGYSKVAVIADSNVAPLYSAQVCESIGAAGYSVLPFSFPAGEASKSMNTVMEILSWLTDNSFTRSDLLVALGGGVTGDLIGFVASIYLRGVDYVQIPTTLLAAIDSSVGGKTAVNIPQGKNLVGSFWQPRLVLCDTATFSTLPESIFADGVAEAVKYGCIWDKALFGTLSDPGWRNASLERVIARCVAIKAEVVAQDERDKGLRQILNFGHTVGHAVEKLSGFGVSHGSAVAIGMCVMAHCGEAAGLTAPGTEAAIEAALHGYHLPTRLEYGIPQVAAACLGDKKREGDSINLITIPEIGKWAITPLPVEQLEDFLNERGRRNG